MDQLQIGLGRLLRLCPKITLNPNDIQRIVDGQLNDVISDYNKPVARKHKIVKKKVVNSHKILEPREQSSPVMELNLKTI